MFYNSTENLLNAFQAELEKKKGDVTKAKRYVQHVKFVWRMIDGKTQVLPQSAFSNCLLIEDKYHNYTLSKIGTPGNQASTLRVRFSDLKMFIQFLRRRRVYGGLTRSDLTKLTE